VTSTPNQLVARVRYFVFALLFATSLLIWGRPLLGTFESALHSDQYTHILLVFPVSAALILVQWAQGHDRGWPGLNTGLPLLTLAHRRLERIKRPIDAGMKWPSKSAVSKILKREPSSSEIFDVWRFVQNFFPLTIK
jgi:hypothetical protein